MKENDSRLQSSAHWLHYADADMRAAKLLQDANDAIGIAEHTIKLLQEWSTAAGVHLV